MPEQKRLANVMRKCGWELKKSDGRRLWMPVPVSASSAQEQAGAS